ncbi:MAG: hypothetical protein CVT65_10390 [Actinobacteria bacterium HGW-Actinobacteria-5]|nr:MAG: hypothetical protein CVT65_10390 [Actinobacteria bacterium HGW-Actinobacteria-5]
MPRSVTTSRASASPGSTRVLCRRVVRTDADGVPDGVDRGAGRGAEIIPRQCGNRVQPQNQVPDCPAAPAGRCSIGASHSGHG